MSDEGDKTCPLCAEEMDLTDQQLKPCKCGYEICVWCWHHIMEMAEKDEAEGRCPACRSPYDKNRIVGTTANCERLVAEINTEKKQKSHKAKIKAAESRKQLSTARVIQRNLVYIVGLPLNLADEDLLQQKEYFGQYGKVMKVSISRTSAGTIQQFANNTCSVYITYSKEEEAIRCIQSVHGFILDGRPLRACFGTTKYCHQWLRNVPCNNPDCLFLHEIGSQEDSFTKDEIISAYSRVQQITGCTNNLQRHSGTVLPPPADDFCYNNSPVMGKPVIKSSSNVPVNNIQCSAPATSSGKSGALPPAASWGSRASNSTPVSFACSNGSIKQKTKANGLSAAVSENTQTSMLPNDGGKKCQSNKETREGQTDTILEAAETEDRVNSDVKGSEASATPCTVPPAAKLGNHLSCPLVAANLSRESRLLPDNTISVGGQPCLSSPVDQDGIPILCSEMSTMKVDKRAKEHSDIIVGSGGLCLGNFISPAGEGLLPHDSEKKLNDDSTSATSTTAAGVVDFVDGPAEWKSDIHGHQVQKLTCQTEDDFDNQRLRDAVVVDHATMSMSPLHFLSYLRDPLQLHADAAGLVNYVVNHTTTTENADGVLGRSLPAPSVACNGFFNNFASCASAQGGHLGSQSNVGQSSSTIRFDSALPNVVDSQSAADLGESSIISNILDLDSWDDSLAKILGETVKQQEPRKQANSSCKGQISNQSRFSFARQEEAKNHLFDFQSSLDNVDQGKNHFAGGSFAERRGPCLDKFSYGLELPHHHSIEPTDNLASSHSCFPSSKLSLSRCQISAPPGFSAPSRPPPPGFSSLKRSDQTFEINSGNHFLETTSLLRNPYPVSPSGNASGASDIELMDPAILAVGKRSLPSAINNSVVDIRPSFHMQAPLFGTNSGLELLTQRSLSPHQNHRYAEVGDNFSTGSDAYVFTSRHEEQSLPNNPSLFTRLSLQQARNTAGINSHWNGWSEVQTGNNIGTVELLRNDRLGFNKFGMASSGDLYDRSFRM